MTLDGSLKYVLTVLFSLAIILAAGCSSEENLPTQDTLSDIPADDAGDTTADDPGDTTADDPGDTPADDQGDDPAPPVVTVEAPANLMGLWEGSLSQNGVDYDVAFAFHMPDGATEGRVMGVTINKATQEHHILIDAGYTGDMNANIGYDFLVGQEGSHGTFLQYYEFSKDLVAPGKGWIKLDLTENTLSGVGAIDGDFTIVLEYSLQNANDTVIANLVGTWIDADAARGWDSSSEGTTLAVRPNGTMEALAMGANSTCQGDGVITDVDSFNIYILDDATIGIGEAVIVSNCGTRDTNLGPATVDGDYSGLGVLLEDESGNQTLVTILSERGQDVPSMAMYNEFIKN